MLKLYNSLSRKREQFKPLTDDKVGMYVCGPTVYNPSHLGHARTWLFFDWLRRYLIYKGYKVKFVQNITDVGHLVSDAERGEDKIEKQARATGQRPEQIARHYEKEYLEDLAALNILKPDQNPRATVHLGEIIDFIQVLLKKGFAYEKEGNVYFDVSSLLSYGQLSGRKTAQALTGTRVEKDSLKKNQSDFSLWLASEPGHLQKWSSPWGDGFPGWHIECSVMSRKYLGQPFDIHGSASEHIFPHHENELAQSMAFAGKPLARFWLHSGMLTIRGQKMAKSLKNFITIKEALAKADADTIKLAFMGTFWRKPMDWNKNAILEARIIKEKLLRAKMKAQPIKTGFPFKLEKVLDDDFNAPRALTVILENITKLSRHDFEVLEKIFGLKLTAAVLTLKQENLLREREKARKKGDYRKADQIRKDLAKEGLMLEDLMAETRVLKKS